MQNIKIEYVDIKKLKTADYNPRIMEKEMMEALKKNIMEFGMVDPIIINADYTVIGGHQRLRACAEMGMETLPAVMMCLDKDQEMALNVALNKIGGSKIQVDSYYCQSCKSLLTSIGQGEITDMDHRAGYVPSYEPTTKEDY